MIKHNIAQVKSAKVDNAVYTQQLSKSDSKFLYEETIDLYINYLHFWN